MLTGLLTGGWLRGLRHDAGEDVGMSGGAVVPYGGSIEVFRQDLEGFRDEWLAAVRSYAAR